MKILRIVALLLSAFLLITTTPAPTRAEPPQTLEARDLFAHLPPNAAQHQPLRVLVALHGVGMRGDTFAQNLIAESDRNGWVLVAPTFNYSNWMEPQQLLADDLKYTQQLNAALDTLPKQLGLELLPQVLIYGFSRGAQLGQRFALFYPERAQAVVAISGGAYTLPSDNSTMPLPYGVGDLRKQLGHTADLARFQRVAFWIAVGENDNRAGDVPRAFDAYIGSTRVERARAFHNALRAQGMVSSINFFPNVGHEITQAEQTRALKFLAGQNVPSRPIRRARMSD